jgi:DNA-binding transcriptional MerR regulator
MKLLSAKDAAAYFNVHPNTIRHWHKTGVIKAVPLGKSGRHRYDVESLKPESKDE